MGKKLVYFAMFAAGAALGTAATWQYFKGKCERIAQEEIDSVKNMFLRREKNLNDSGDSEMKKEEPATPVETSFESLSTDIQVERVDYNGFAKRADSDDKAKKILEENKNKPIVIDPVEYGEIEEYEQIELRYYNNKVLTDDMDDIVYDVDGTVGRGSLETFGEYEADSVHVRNDRLNCYYEILRIDDDFYTDDI